MQGILSCKCCGQGTVNKVIIDLIDFFEKQSGREVIVNSGFRCEKANELAGGVKTSAHLTGEAVDIHIPDSLYRYLIHHFMLRNGIRRIGIGNTFEHYDISKTLPSPRIWTY